MRSVAWLALALAPSLLLAQKKPFDASAMLKIQRIADPQLSPDGKTVAFAVSLPDIDANKSLHSVWTVPLEGGMPHKLADLADRPRWSPDGKRLYYVSTAGDASQIWSMSPDGSGASQITHLSTEADGELVSSDGKYLIVTSGVYPECTANSSFDDACNQKHLDAEKQNKVKARLITGLLYRHWPLGKATAAAICSRSLSPTARWPISRPACARFLRFLSAVPTTTPSRPTARKSASR
jgi:dipeptidyl aminopeptidase/acylaminoacyl peptidase